MKTFLYTQLFILLALMACNTSPQKNAVSERRLQIKNHLQTELSKTQADLAHTDSLLQQAIKEYNIQKQITEQKRKELNATAEDLQKVTLLRIRRDSLQVRFDVAGARIRYIHKKQRDL